MHISFKHNKSYLSNISSVTVSADTVSKMLLFIWSNYYDDDFYY